MDKNKTIAIIVIILVVGLGIYYFVSKKNSNVTETANVPVSDTQLPLEPSVSDTNTPAASTRSGASVSIKNFSFNPATISVKKGTKITWINNDKVSHTATPDSGNRFNSGKLAPGKSFSFIATDLGTINYHCAIHPGMKGTIVVHK